MITRDAAPAVRHESLPRLRGAPPAAEAL